MFSPVHAQDDTTDFLVPVISETYTVPLTIGDRTGVITVTVKGSNILSISTSLDDAELGDPDRLPPVAHSVALTETLYAVVDIPEFPAGEKGELDVVEINVHEYDDLWDTTSVDVVLRNNTKKPLGPLSLEAEAYSEDGEFLGEGDNTFSIFPKVVEPGQLAFGEIVFRGIELLETDIVEIYPDESWLAGDLIALKVDSWKHSTRSGKSITGTLVNPSDDTVEFDSVHLLCFDDGRYADNAWLGSGDSPATNIEPGEAVPFQFNSDCQSFIISAAASE